jgi:hypothetical protein
VWGDIAGIGGREAVEATEDFDSFYAAVFARLVGQLTVVTGDPHEAEDVVQEAMARAASRWARLRAYDAPEAWVRRVAFNLAVSAHRRARRRVAALLRLGPPLPVPPVSVDALALAQALQVLGREGVPDQMLRDVAQGLRIVGTAGGTVKVTAGPPPGWVRAGQQVGLPTAGDYLRVLPRRHEEIFTKGPGQRRAPSFVIAEVRGRYGPLRSADKPRHLPETTRESVRVRGYPALLDHDPANRVLEVTWREPGGIELSVKADEGLGRREVLAIAEGLRQP